MERARSTLKENGFHGEEKGQARRLEGPGKPWILLCQAKPEIEKENNSQRTRL